MLDIIRWAASRDIQVTRRKLSADGLQTEERVKLIVGEVSYSVNPAHICEFKRVLRYRDYMYINIRFVVSK